MEEDEEESSLESTGSLGSSNCVVMLLLMAGNLSGCCGCFLGVGLGVPWVEEEDVCRDRRRLAVAGFLATSFLAPPPTLAVEEAELKFPL